VTTESLETPAPTSAKTRVKICGITREEDARLAVQENAWAIGMIMWPASPRYVELQRAADIARVAARSSEIVGVFVDQPLDEVVALTTEIGLTMVQLHGNEGQQFAHAVTQRTGAKVIKAFRVKDRSIHAELGKFYNVDYHLLDTYKAGVPGGTGETFDWRFISETTRRGNVPLILSGGLTPENVGLAVETVGPYAVDVSSGVEVEGEPGIKDPEKIKAFFAAVNGAVSPRWEAPEAPKTGAEEEVLTLAYERRIQAELALEKSQSDRRADYRKSTGQRSSERE
jgi:phosphoribosylanthranilate isomerase